MSRPRRATPHLAAASALAGAFHEGFDELRRELDIVDEFPPDAMDEASAPRPIPQRAGAEPIDARDLPLVTIDPPHSLDLDQAYAARRTGEGYEISYAIADPAAPRTRVAKATPRAGAESHRPA